MSNSRRRLIAQINRIDYQLALQKNKVKEYQSSLKEVRIKHSHWIILALLLPTIAIGWKMRRGKWVSKIAIQVTEVLTITILSYFRRLVVNLLSK